MGFNSTDCTGQHISSRGVHLAVNKLITDETKIFLFDSWTFWIHKIYLKQTKLMVHFFRTMQSEIWNNLILRKNVDFIYKNIRIDIYLPFLELLVTALILSDMDFNISKQYSLLKWIFFGVWSLSINLYYFYLFIYLFILFYFISTIILFIISSFIAKPKSN